MNGQNNLKYYVISDISQKYDDINKKIINFTKLYFYTMKNHSYQIIQIENKLNEYNIKGEVKIKQLLENQQNIIKELIKIINNLLFERRNSQISKKLEEQIKIDSYQLKQNNILTNNNNNTHIFSKPFYPLGKSNNFKNNLKEKRLHSNENMKNISTNETFRSNLTKSVDDKNAKKILNQKKIVSLNVIAPKNGNEFNGALSFLNIKSSNTNKKKIFGKFVNKETKKNSKPLKHKIIKSMSTSEISYKPKVMNKNNLYLKTNNISNDNPYYIINNNNYTIDEEKNDNIEPISLINERQNSIGSNINENYGNLPHILTKRKKRIKYRGAKILLTEKDNNRNMVRVKSAKEIPIKTEFYINTNSSYPNYNLNNSFMERNGNFSYNQRCNSSLCFFNGNTNYDLKESYKSIKKVENEVYSIPYINNGKRIIPTRFTKEVLNNSYKILNKYEQKRFKNYKNSK